MNGKNSFTKILVADDHFFIRRVICESLRSVRDFDIVEALNGRRALFELGVVMADHFPEDGSLPEAASFSIRRAPIDCMITDFNMPHVNGLALLRMIRAGLTGVRRDLPVVMVTGCSDSPLLSAALQLDVNAFVVKPVAKTMLLERIRDGLTTPWTLKTAAEYAAVEIPTLHLDTAPSDAVFPLTDAPRGIPLQALMAGAVLSEDLCGRNGKLLLAEGTELTESLVHRIREIAEIAGLTHIPVDLPAERSSGSRRVRVA